VFEGHLGRGFRLHVGEVVLVFRPSHPGTDDIEKREDACFGAIDDALLEILKVAPAGAAGVGRSRNTGAEREPVGIEAVVSCIRSAFARARIRARGYRPIRA
jgi:hypothetical protein